MLQMWEKHQPLGCVVDKMYEAEGWDGNNNAQSWTGTHQTKHKKTQCECQLGNQKEQRADKTQQKATQAIFETYTGEQIDVLGMFRM